MGSPGQQTPPTVVQEHPNGRRKAVVQVLIGLAAFGLLALIISDVDNLVLRIVLSALVGGAGWGLAEWLI